ncbi:hypothetical protein C0Q70_05736 [Pomacea canaliculata]|uniref:WW domain-containing protein n=2 Tax=Pomacea canaliculata TaxID=400727 RepID=A0A2T7PM10_POMCA|nr:hypothetical protein C0Q70_05736 [Pomacea canaliculata]
MRKRSAEKAKEQEELDEGMAQMEKAALEAFKKDLANDSSLAEQYGVKLKSTEEKGKTEDSTKGSSKTEDSTKGSSKGELDNTKTTIVPAKGREWFEAKSPEGYSYYWNVSTNETKWEPPDDYVSLAEQEEQITTDDSLDNSEKDQSSEECSKESPQELEDGDSCEPPQKTLRVDIGSRSAYGAWETVEKEPLPELELPGEELPGEELPVEELPVEDIPLPGEIPDLVEKPATKIDKFKEKVVPSLGGTSDGAVEFKKRKITSGARNMRQRDDD